MTRIKFDGTDDIFDSRDALERIAELEELGERYREQPEEDEYTALKALESWAEDNVSDWTYGEQFIHADYFEEYAEQAVKDAGCIPNDFPAWIVIDWAETADSLKEDYEEVEFRGSTYFVRL